MRLPHAMRTALAWLALPIYLLVGLVFAVYLVMVYGYDEAMARIDRESL